MKITQTLLGVLFFCCLGLGCSVTIPATDNIPPTISFSIVGPGVRTTINNQALADRKQLNLKFNETYTITCIVSDAGGVNRNLVLIPLLPPLATFGEFKDQDNNILSPNIGTIRLSYAVLGNPGSPKSGFIITGTFSVAELVGFDITIQGADFGGRAATVNNSSLQIHCLGDKEGAVINL